MLLLDSLAALEHVDKRRGTYSLSKSGRKWLDPASDDYVGTYIEHCFDYWSWWDRLEDIVRTGEGIEIHDFAPDDPALGDVHPRAVRAGAHQLPGGREGAAAAVPADVAARRRRRPRLVFGRAVPAPSHAARDGARPARQRRGRTAHHRRAGHERPRAARRGRHDERRPRRPARRRAVLQHRAPPVAGAERRAAAPACTRRSTPGGTVAVLDLWLPEDDRRARRRRDARPVLLPHVVGGDLHRARRARVARGGRLRARSGG